MRVVADENIPNIERLFGVYAQIKRVPGRSISSADIADADVLLVRSVTRVNKSLLENSRVAFVGSATIGTDHIDIEYLREQGIIFAYAPGCNASAVVQYDLSVFARLRPNWRNARIGIVGCGNVGGRLYRVLKALGVDVQVYDPFLTRNQVPDLTDLGRVAESDILCLHTPLTRNGAHPTEGMLNHEYIDALPSGAVLINAGRGEVIDNDALLQRLLARADLHVALDVWACEPHIDRTLVQTVSIATPHIAGHSQEGKERGVRMLHDAFLTWQRLPKLDVEPMSSTAHINTTSGDEDTVNRAILASYDVLEDDRRFRHAVNQANAVGPAFDAFRKAYPVRREFTHYRYNPASPHANSLKTLGFLPNLPATN